MQINDKTDISLTVEDFFQFEEDLTFKIPYYQRNYSWKFNIQIKTMLDDAFFFKNKQIVNKKNHFWGIVVSKKNDQYFEIIDGQQRLATFSLFLVSILNKYSHMLSKENEKKIKKALFRENYEILRLQMDNSNKDDTVYNSILKKQKCPNVKNKLYEAYNGILSYLEKLNLGKDDVNEVINFFFKTNIVHIVLESQEDNPQNVFESLNSKGMELSVADLVKNYIFMNISDTSKQESYYKRFWIPIENGLKKDGEIANFLRDYLVINFDENIEQLDNSLYFKFREKIKITDQNIEQELEKINMWLNIYISVTKNFQYETLKNHEDYNKYLKINNIANKMYIYFDNIKVGNVVLLFLSELFFSGILDENKLKKIFELVNNYVLMWSFRPNKGHLHKAFVWFFRDLNDKRKQLSSKDFKNINIGKMLEKYLKENSGQFAILSKNEYMQFFVASTTQGLNKYLSMILEIRLNKKINMNIIYKNDKENKWNIEHVLPQNLDDKEFLDKNPRYKEMIWKIGNLFYIDESINEKAKNMNFLEKKEEYKNSESVLIDDLLELDKFGESEIFNQSELKFELFSSHFQIEYKKPIF